ncbi:MAG TPA: hypothetical protein VGK58_15645 [Lacipirellulaceae bacterium]
MYWLLCKNTFRSLLAVMVIVGVVRGAEFVVVEEGFELSDAQFNQWVYGSNRAGIDADSEIAVAVQAVDRACQLTELQREKLLLAGRGDFARFGQRVDEMRAKYTDKMHDQNDIGRIHQEIQPLNVTYQAGLLGPSSLFDKVLRGMLAPEQLEKYNAEKETRNQARHDAKVRLFVASLERRCPLKDEQRSALVELLLAETRPPTRSSQFDHYVVLVQAARISDEKFKTILDAEQYRVFAKTLEQARAVEPHLKQQGVLP